MASLQNIRGHFKTITKHKLIVMSLCFKCGLIRQGLTHDLSKYMPVEFKAGCKHYQGFRSPNAQERELYGYSEAWLHHKGRNRHHFEYWIDAIVDYDVIRECRKNRTVPPIESFHYAGCIMPTRYVIEMFCDRVAASKVYQGDKYTDASALDYFHFEVGPRANMMHPDTAAFLEELLVRLSETGEQATLTYIKERYVSPRAAYSETSRF